MQAVNPSLAYVCDPVLGDNGKLYVPEELVDVYREEVVKHATILTPNQFEIEVLSGVKINTMADAIEACNVIHAKGVPVVVITSMEIVPDKIVMLCSAPVATVKLHGKAATPSPTFPSHTQFHIQCDRLPRNFTGTGDVTAALILAWYMKCKDDLVAVMENTFNSMQFLCSETYKRDSFELALIESLEYFRSPVVEHRIQAVDY
jgi:pyridoxine kinase